MRRITALALMMALVPVAAAAQQTTGSLAGTVRSLENGHPLGGTRITVTAPSMHMTIQADPKGRFAIQGLPGGIVGLVLTHGGYTPVRMKACVHPGETFRLPLVMNVNGGSDAAERRDRKIGEQSRLRETHDQYFVSC